MTAFLPGLIVGTALATLAWGALFLLLLVHRPRHEAPVLRRRRNRDRPEVHVPPMPGRKPARVDEVGVNYQWLGVTGSEQE